MFLKGIIKTSLPHAVETIGVFIFLAIVDEKYANLFI